MIRRALMAAVAAGLVAAAPAQADTFNVTGGGDSATPPSCTNPVPAEPPIWECTTLRAAINTANDIPDVSHMIVIGVPSVVLTAAALNITSDMTISGAGAAQTSVGWAADPGDRVFTTSQAAAVSMIGFTIRGGFSGDTGGNVEVQSPSSLSLLMMRVTGGNAATGGGIENRSTLGVHYSLIDGNAAGMDGGGIHTAADAETELVNTTIAGNTAPLGAGIAAANGSTTGLTHVTVGRNTGSGVASEGVASAHATIIASNTGPACVSTTFRSASFSVAGDASCGFGIVGNPGLSANVVNAGGESETGVLTIPAGSIAEDVVVPCQWPYDQRIVERYTVVGAPCDAGAYERAASDAGGSPPPPPPPVVTLPPDPPPVVTPEPTPTPTPEPTPVFAREVVVEPVRGTVLVCLRGQQCRPLRTGEDIPMGSTIDTRKGEVELTSLSSRGGKPQTARFRDGIFRVSQSGSVTTLTLTEALDCRRGRASAAQKKRKPKTRKLWGNGKGKFRTKGQYSAATIRGTKWLVQDTCTTTLTRVTQGAVTVRDTVRKRTVVVRKGKRYVARARR